MSVLPFEILVYIGFYLEDWNDIWSYSTVFKALRKHKGYAVFARSRFLKSLNYCTYKSYSDHHFFKFGDDRCRHQTKDGVLFEHWKCEHPWIDYTADFQKREITINTWCYMPYGISFLSDSCSTQLCGCYVCKRKIVVERLCHKSCFSRLPTLRENSIKEKYDNSIKSMIIYKFNSTLKKSGGLFSSPLDINQYKTYSFIHKYEKYKHASPRNMYIN